MGLRGTRKKEYAHDLRCQLDPRFLTAAVGSRGLAVSRAKIFGKMAIPGGSLVVAMNGTVVMVLLRMMGGVRFAERLLDRVLLFLLEPGRWMSPRG